MSKDPEHGYVVEVTEKPTEGGGTSRANTFLDASQLVRREVERLLRAWDGPLPNDRQQFVLQAVVNLASQASTKGHRETLGWLIGYGDGILRGAAEARGKKYYPMSGDPAANQFEGIHDAQPSDGERAFEALKRAVTASVKRVGEHEWDGTGPAGASDNWGSLAKLKARGARKDKAKNFVDVDKADTDRHLQHGVGLDVIGLANELNLDSEECAYLLHFQEFKRAKLAEHLSQRTGEKWDLKRLDRVRKRIEYRWSEIKEVAQKYRTTWVNGQSIVLLKDQSNPAGAWTHALLRRLFS